MKQLIKNNLPFLLPTVLFWLLLSVLLLSYSKADLHLLLNSYHTHSLDVFFSYYTELGANIPIYIGVLLLFFSFRKALLVLVTQLIAAPIVYGIKQFYDSPRPVVYFNQLGIPFPQVEGVHLHITNSFPSGHTVSAFAFFLCLSFLVRNPLLKLVFFILALGVAYSRVYLSQHFVGDVFAGSVLGVVVAFIGCCFYQKNQAAWLDKSLFKLKIKS
jgi:membrane-associated phospholipid phosphatase